MHINSRSDQIQKLIKNDQKEESIKMRDEVTLLKNILNKEKPDLEQKIRSLEQKLLLVPNLPHPSVPPGKTPGENEIVREGGDKPKLHAGALPHWELAKKYDLINFELGQ